MLVKLFLTFFRLGLLTIGGGYAMLAQLEQELITHHEWLTRDEFLEITAIAQITPGPIAINAATFVGMRMAGTAGSLVASFAVVLPPLIIVGFLAGHLAQWVDDPALHGAFIASRYAAAALILHASIRMLRQGVTSNLGRLLFLAGLATLMFTSLHPLFVIVAGAGTGLLLNMMHCLPGGSSRT
ncbi:chromate transporter [Sansalvadorimonas sp. 2012CJ34-2]|uniref:Chromate transporter n=1 Tax=Parendozoicomonas callyspongiae TaxID=2942213 RepID=A0ABT0PJQ8_9GAMM|nr:chromate transporter [Sansalvadorimonas sp. 2012CJ34-2]MCL6271568.1 chromate transporter [Sansalvadorimonas sp. 2012CJ34-2]